MGNKINISPIFFIGLIIFVIPIITTVINPNWNFAFLNKIGFVVILIGLVHTAIIHFK